MPDDNIIWKSLHWQDADLVTLARRAGEVHRFLEVAQCHGLSWEEAVDGAMRDFRVVTPTDRLESFVRNLRARRIPFGTVDCRSEEALALCRKLGIKAELLEPAPLSA